MKNLPDQHSILSAPLYEDGEQFRLKYQNGDSHENAEVAHSIAQSYLMEGRLEEAEIYFQKAIQAYEQSNNADYAGLAMCLSQYAVVLRFQSKRDYAEELLIKVVKLSKNLGLNRQDVKSWFLKVYFLNLFEFFDGAIEARTLRKKLSNQWQKS